SPRNSSRSLDARWRSGLPLNMDRRVCERPESDRCRMGTPVSVDRTARQTVDDPGYVSFTNTRDADTPLVQNIARLRSPIDWRIDLSTGIGRNTRSFTRDRHLITAKIQRLFVLHS